MAQGVFPVAYTGRLRQKRLGTSFRLQVYEMKVVARGFIQVEEYEMIGKSVIEICGKDRKALTGSFYLFFYLLLNN